MPRPEGEGRPAPDGPDAPDAPDAPVAIEALALAAAIGADAPTLIHVVASQARARSLHALVRALRPDQGVGFYPEWDCPPHGGASPSPAVMGRRMGLLHWLLGPDARPALVLATAPALLRRVAPRSAWDGARFEFRAGQRIDPEAIAAGLERIGYVRDGRVDVPGEFALRGQVIDLFPAAAPMPCRIEHDEGAIVAIRAYDPRTQRSLVVAETLLVDPASEAIGGPGDGHGRLETIFDYAPAARLLLGPGVPEAAAQFLEEAGDAEAVLPAAQWAAERARRALPDLDRPDWRPVPRFVEQARPERRLRRLLADLPDGWRIVLAAPDADAAAALGRAVEDATGRTAQAAEWPAVADAAGGSLLAVRLPVDRGFLLPDAAVAVLAAGDVVGSRAARRATAEETTIPGGPDGFRVGDLLLHLDHGLGRLEGVDRAEWLPGRHREAIRLRYAGDGRMIVPVSELDRVWRYGGEADGVALHRLDDEAWPERRRALEAEIERTAARLLRLIRARRRRRAPRLVPDEAAFERFAARFPFPLSDDQAAAVEAIRRDLASGRPMDRIVCGDVGFGKTEVALRAAAIAVLAGHQAAVVAPTTVLARQHWRTFHKRFQAIGVEVAYLSGASTPAEAGLVREALAEGRLRLVVGTHALLAGDLRLWPGSLVVIDEEHRFGAEDKARLRKLAGGEKMTGGHALTLTATPIPRTLQAALVGLHDLSVVSTPPAERRPVRTVVAPFSDALVADALRQERRRGGQSFLVCPRIADIAAMEARIQALVPDLRLQVLHGRMKRAAMDERMAAFAEGDGDLLLATNIVESGLDIANANTILVWRADRFGLAQLHQLRGRVGRGEREGVAYLLTQPGKPAAPATARRLATLEEADRFGAGFVVSRRDLDLRGAGDLLGEDQAGHVALLGLDLYRHLLDRAMRRAAGEAVEEEWSPDLRIDLEYGIPEDYVPDPEMRIALHAAAARLDSAAAIDRFAGELADRFGPPPEPTRNLLALCRLRLLCRQAGVARLIAGPRALALHLRPGGPADRATPPSGWCREEDRLVLRRDADAADPAAGQDAIDAATRLLRAVAAQHQASRRPAGRGAGRPPPPTRSPPPSPAPP
ncbi:transcription-repair-coupling factor [Allostella vacuolata]|nr:transcription-repair-coupling factor [Stella vacuolata]